MNGDEDRSARLFAAMAAADPGDRTIARRAIATAIQSGQAELAVSLARNVPPAELPVDARLMLAADSLRQGKTKQAVDRSREGRHIDRGRSVRPAGEGMGAYGARKG